MRAFDACILCLTRARDPVSCPRGHIYCRECALANLLAQKQDIKRRKVDAERQKRRIEDDQERADQEAKARIIKDFERAQGSIASQATKIDNDQGGDSPRGQKRKIELSESDQLERAKKQKDEALAKVVADKAEALKSALPSFWSPSLTPSTNSVEIKEVKVLPQCAGSEEAHELSLKTLIDVKFSTEKDDAGNPAYICPSCRKGLTNSLKTFLMQPCGHVVCKTCADQFVRKAKSCFVCSAALKDKDIIALSVDGTGFSGNGKAQVSKYNVAFS